MLILLVVVTLVLKLLLVVGRQCGQPAQYHQYMLIPINFFPSMSDLKLNCYNLFCSEYL